MLHSACQRPVTQQAKRKYWGLLYLLFVQNYVGPGDPLSEFPIQCDGLPFCLYNKNVFVPNVINIKRDIGEITKSRVHNTQFKH